MMSQCSRVTWNFPRPGDVARAAGPEIRVRAEIRLFGTPRSRVGLVCALLWLGFIMSTPYSPTDRQETDHTEHSEHPSIIQRSLQAVFSPFSPAALALLPRLRRPARYTRADDIPETQPDSEGQQPTVRDYYSINLPPQVRVPKKVSTPIRVEGKVWFANERSG